MNALLIEDEDLAAERLASMLRDHDPDIQIVGTLDSVTDAVEWFSAHPRPDLIFLDIQLSDGIGFSIFKRVTINSPVIFTTAYDQYAIQAFSVNSIDYLLKPINRDQLGRALDKWRSRLMPLPAYPLDVFQEIARNLARMAQSYKSRFLVRYGDHIQFKNVSDVAYFYADGKTVYLVTLDSKRYIIEYTLEELETQLDPARFFRVNRKVIAQIQSIRDIRTHLGGRLRLQLQPAAGEDILVSRERVADFKSWLEY